MIELSSGFAESIAKHSVTGELTAEFVRDGGKTVLGYSSHRTPLKLAKSFAYPDGRAAMCMMDCSPGVLSGDHYSIDVRLHPGCDVHVTNQSFTKVHPARVGVNGVDTVADMVRIGGVMVQRVAVGAGAFLDYDVEPTMLYKDARFRSVVEIEMDADSHLAFHEILCPGRASRGELFQFAQYDGDVTVRHRGELIYANRLRMQPALLRANETGLWGRYTHFGTLLLISDAADGLFLDQIQSALQSSKLTLNMEVGASLAYRSGVVVSGLSMHAWELQWLFRQLVSQFRDRVNK